MSRRDVTGVECTLEPEYATAEWIDRLILRAATFDELLSDDFESLPGQKTDSDLATRRLAAWCRNAASGDWALFVRRLDRDGLSLIDVLKRFSTARRRASVARPDWVGDALWLAAALEREPRAASGRPGQCAFEDLLIPAVEEAETLLWSSLGARVRGSVAEPACDGLRRGLLSEFSDLCAPALYKRFCKTKLAERAEAGETSQYAAFVDGMRTGGFGQLFDEKPVLLRLMAVVARQWLDATTEMMTRLDRDKGLLEGELLGGNAAGRVLRIEGDLSDPHNGGRTVKVLTFESGARVVYKPKDLRLDLAWHRLITRLNESDPPIDLRTVRTIVRDRYGWTEWIDHVGCSDFDGFRRFFRRSGAWLALFHAFAATDMHHENVIALGDQPVPIDLEMVLQAGPEQNSAKTPDALAFQAALEELGNSVLMVGLLPNYTRTPDNEVRAAGGLISNFKPSKNRLIWNDLNSDAMRPVKGDETSAATSNLPHVGGRYAEFIDYVDDFVGGFEDYATFLLATRDGTREGGLLDGFGEIVIRRVIRQTRFYHLLLERLKNEKHWEDGVLWSVQADFLARLADWDIDTDLLWPLQRSERASLLALNVPYFVAKGDETEICDSTGSLVKTTAVPGITRARGRIRGLTGEDIAWQSEIIRQSALVASTGDGVQAPRTQQWDLGTQAIEPVGEMCLREADEIASELARYALRRGPAAAWIGLDWLGDTEISQFVLLGPELYNGAAGIGAFLAAHAAVTGNQQSAELAFSSVVHLRKDLTSATAARFARSLGVGIGTGLASIIYGLSVMSNCLSDPTLLEDAHRAAELFIDDLIAADTLFDVVGGSAGAILGLLHLHRVTASELALRRATQCGEHLLAQHRIGPVGARTWLTPGLGPRVLTGMSHGAAGFAYALASLSVVTEREDFALAAAECLAFEHTTYDAERMTWPDLRGEGEPRWAYQWCHGAPGIGLARLGMLKHGLSAASTLDAAAIATDVENAVGGVEHDWPGHLDTLCCGTFGGIELLREASVVLRRDDLRDLARRQLETVVAVANSRGDFRWKAGSRRFNLGLFRGLAGIGYTLLREIDDSLPNMLIFE